MRLPALVVRALPLLLLACTEKEDPRSPPIGEECEGREFCVDPGGGPSGGVGAVPGGGSANDDEDGGDDASGGASPGPNGPDGGVVGTLHGMVDVLAGPDTTQGTDFTVIEPLDFGEVEISAPGSADERVSVRYQGDGEFSLPGVGVNPNLWVAVDQTIGLNTQPLFTTLQNIDSTSAASIRLSVVDQLSLSNLATVGYLSMPTELDEDRGHAVLRFIDDDGEPVPGIQLVNGGAISDATVAYDLNDVFSDATGETDLGGSALILNMGAEIFPGGPKEISYRHMGEEFAISIEVAREAVTLATIIVTGN